MLSRHKNAQPVNTAEVSEIGSSMQIVPWRRAVKHHAIIYCQLFQGTKLLFSSLCRIFHPAKQLAVYAQGVYAESL